MPIEKVLEIDSRKVHVTSPDKLLWPVLQVSKLDVIAYYLAVADFILPYLKARPVLIHHCTETMDEDCLLEWKLPSSAPKWIGRYEYRYEQGNTPLEMALIEEPAALAYMVNRMNLEFHALSASVNHPNHPDYAVFDLIPSDSVKFAQVAEAALLLRDLLKEMGLIAYAKTSGEGGLQVYLPLEPIYTFPQVLNFVEKTGDRLSQKNSKLMTISQGNRQGKVLIDYTSNARGKALVVPYSVRPMTGAPVSTPVEWRELEQGIQDPIMLNILTIPRKVKLEGDPFARVIRGNQRLPEVKAQTGSKGGSSDFGNLQDYQSKRSFDRTPEPSPEVKETGLSRFVVQEHHASHLHWDFRLELDGVLKSWAVPKGMPTEPKIRRLGVQTEDHPVGYIDFEGMIDEGQYGAGEVLIWDQGTFDLIERTPEKYQINLHGEKLSGEYMLIHTGDKNWLIFKRG